MSSLGHSAFGHEVVYDDTPISLHQADSLDRLAREAAGTAGDAAAGTGRGLTLQELFVGRTSKSEMIGLFLATLELDPAEEDRGRAGRAAGGDTYSSLCDTTLGQVLFQEENGVGAHLKPLVATDDSEGSTSGE